MFNILWEGIENETSTQNITISYYDSYHQDIIYWNNITFLVRIFASEPPLFDKTLDNITVSSWSIYEYVLPNASDPDNDSFTINVVEENDYWTYILYYNF